MDALWLFPLLFAAGLAAGWVNAVTGGGGLVVLPIFLAVGFPPHLALGTNMLQSSAGTLAAAYTFVRHRQVDLSEARIGIAWTLVGAVAGLVAVERLDPMVLKDLLPLVLLGIVLSNSNHMTLVHAICRYLNLSGLSQRSAYRHAPTTAKLRANVFTVDLAACSRFPGREHRRSRLG